MVTLSYLILGAYNYRGILQRLLSFFRPYMIGLQIILLCKLFLLSVIQISLLYHFMHIYLKYTIQKKILALLHHFFVLLQFILLLNHIALTSRLYFNASQLIKSYISKKFSFFIC